MKNILPKVIFKQISLELETEMFSDFLDMEYWGNKITDKYPEFLKVREIKGKKEKNIEIKNLIVKIRSNLGSEIDGGLENIKNNWGKVESNYLEKLSEIIQTDWPARDITAYISINPVCPRFLDSWSFSITYDRENTNVVIAHEVSHFLFFKKLKEVFPEINRENYESPHKEWLLSEIVAVIISHDSRIFNILGVKDNFYPEHKKLMVGDEQLVEVVEKLYDEFVIKKGDFSEFLRESIKLELTNGNK